MVYRTVKEWNLRGKRVISGQRATAWTTSGHPLFARYQVRTSDAKIKRAISYILS